MKKSIKVILAALLVMMLTVAMIPTASAADPTLTIRNENADFTFDLYEIATLKSETTGEYQFPTGLNTAAKAAVNTAGQNGSAFLAALDDIDDLGIQPVAKLSGKTGTGYTQEHETNIAGIYYARVSEQPSGGNVAKVKNAVIVWPEYKSGAWDYSDNTVDLATKVGTDRIHKNFSDTNSATKEAGEGDTISFTLSADIVGNANDLATKYQIWDKMCPGLQYVAKSAHVFYDGTTTSADADFDVAVQNNITDTDAKYNKGTSFTFSAKATVLENASSDYYAHKMVYVTYDAKVLNTAGIGKDYNPNKDGLVYKLTSSTGDVERDGDEVKVYTYSATATKIDASATAKEGTNKPLAGAVVGLFTKSGTTLTEIARGTSDAQGKVTFTEGGDTAKQPKRLAPGSYVVKEISAPDGYVLSDVEYPLTITADHNGDGIFNLDDSKVVENFATKLPETGGQGTLMFTLIGAGLILCAGVLFVIIMKKKATK